MKERNSWKIIAIVFIILFVVENIVLITVLKIGYDELDKESRCSNDICEGIYGGYDSFKYDAPSQMCYCFIKGEIAKKESMR